MVKRELICVHVCSFTFRFESKEEIEEYIKFFQAILLAVSRKHTSKLQPSTLALTTVVRTLAALSSGGAEERESRESIDRGS